MDRSSADVPVVAVFANKGDSSNEEARIQMLLGPLEPRHWPFDRGSKPRTAGRLLARIAKERPAIVVMEGTGLAGGLAIMAGRILFGVPYVVSSGDAVAPFFGLQHRGLSLIGYAYERLLYKLSAGFIGWTPYLVGRALTLGAKRGITAENWAPFGAEPDGRETVRARLGLSHDQIVIGLVGALNWSSRRRYCYGLELVRAIRRVSRPDITVVVVGGGDGRRRLIEAAGADLHGRILLPGPVDPADVPAYLAAFDAGSLPQSLDGVGSFRYTTKISEYLRSGLPVVTGRLPFAYDLDDGWLWRLPGDAPWSDDYVSALAQWMEGLTANDITVHRNAIPAAPQTFDKDRQVRRVSAFVAELLEDL